jgi:hypothetical protein
MKKGDLCFFYHSNIGKEIVGIVEVIKTAFLDKTDKEGRFVAIQVKFKEKFKNVELHLLGPLQRNKVRDAVRLFDFIHTVDNIKLAQRISLIMEETGRCPKLFIQVNTGNEPQKAGVDVDNLENLLTVCSELRLPVVGLMCIPPVLEDPSPHFDALRTLKEKYGLSELSMGMSNDFEKAILAGASYIRVGSAIFGQRP